MMGECRSVSMWVVCVCVVVGVAAVTVTAESSSSSSSSSSNTGLIQDLDTILMTPPRGGYKGVEHFGFSVSHFTDADSRRWLLVGAPKSTISKPEVKTSGGVYKCRLDDGDGGGGCEEMVVSLENSDSYPVWAKNNNTEQGLGFTIASDGHSVVVCAPQWFAARSKFNEMSYLPVGMCFAATSPSYHFKGLSPPFDNQDAQTISYLTTGSCQFGLSATYMKNENTFAFGAPGCWSWKGDVWKIGLGNNGQREAAMNLGKDPKDIQDAEVKDTHTYSYTGYSVAYIKFGGENAIVSSVPRNAEGADDNEDELLGPNILILTPNSDDKTTLRVRHRIYPSKQISKQMRFTFYGYSLATLDMNGDGLDDLVVGVPFHRSLHTDQEIERGAVITYTQTATTTATTGDNSTHTMNEEENAPVRIGRGIFSRFGSCLAALGDLDADGYEDLAVGAPFMSSGSIDGSGAVYIYMGSPKGLEKNPIQVIYAQPNLFGFGSSITQRLPSIEGQGYDLAVGAYRSDAVVVYRSKESVEVTWSLALSGPIDPNNKECLCDHEPSLCGCVGLTYCLDYHRRVAKYETNREMEFAIDLNSGNDDLKFENGKTEMKDMFHVLEDDNRFCKTLKIYTPTKDLEIKSYTIKGIITLAQQKDNVILDRRSDLMKSVSLSVNASAYQSDLTLHSNILQKYTLHSNLPMKINFNIKNQRDTAFETKLNIRGNATAFNIDGIERSSNITCDTNAHREIVCLLGRLDYNAEIDFSLNLRPAGDFYDSLDTHESFFDMTAQVKTLSGVVNPDSAVQVIRAPIIVEGTLQLIKDASVPNIVYFNSSDYFKPPSQAVTEEQLGPEIRHVYRILNSNKYSVYKSQLRVLWPRTIRDKHFLYLMESLSFDDKNHNCQYPDGLLDPFSLNTNKPALVQQYVNATTQGSGGDGGGGGGTAAAALSSVREGSSFSPQYEVIVCSLGRISAKSEITVSLRGRLVLKTLAELEVGTAVKDVLTILEVTIVKMPLNYPPPPPSNASIATTISYSIESPTAKVPVWWIVAGVFGGLFVLGIVIVILWKFGFFKRRITKSQERLNEEQEQEEQQQEQDENNLAAAAAADDDDDVRTPTKHLMQQTQNADEEFVYHKNN